MLFAYEALCNIEGALSEREDVIAEIRNSVGTYRIVKRSDLAGGPAFEFIRQVRTALESGTNSKIRGIYRELRQMVGEFDPAARTTINKYLEERFSEGFPSV